MIMRTCRQCSLCASGTSLTSGHQSDRNYRSVLETTGDRPQFGSDHPQNGYAVGSLHVHSAGHFQRMLKSPKILKPHFAAGSTLLPTTFVAHRLPLGLKNQENYQPKNLLYPASEQIDGHTYDYFMIECLW